MLGDRWGVTPDELARRYPCDDLVPAPSLQLWRGVTVDTAPADVWPWLCQIRLAPYSYDWVDNLGRRSPQDLRGLPDPVPGQRFSTVGGRFAVGRVLSVTHEEQLTATIMGAVMSYVVSRAGDGSRLLLKVVASGPRRWRTTALGLGDWPMARRQLLNLKRLAESSAASRRDDDARS